ncbi:type A2 lantipeptide [Streptomyces sp. NPDC002577]
MNFTPQVETREISDADLDNVSGGIVGELVGNVTGIVDSVAPVSSTLTGVVGTVEGVTGLNTAPILGTVSGLTAGL